ncbi:MAG: TlyA family RNA methyltransferase [Acholeplasmataceae bacterium]|jgi:23S rRNA (cytidine1920-2'-O)/16S rRNA (cytidine1409-2'-O)-methyltransferase|nr:TlyA family RNA methyltransferase [Acholeplasmataceae bacterium]
MRLDKYLVTTYNYSRSKAIDLIKIGDVKVNKVTIYKPAYKISSNDQIEITETLKYVSRAGLKLEDAINHFKLDFTDKVVIDVGSSTGGFTDCSLSYGAKHVYAYDVGKDQMVDKLKNNKKVTLFEQTNILNVEPINVDICLIDVSFISIKPILKHLKDSALLFVMLFKPQFEVGKQKSKSGIIKDSKLILKALTDFGLFLKSLEINLIGYKPSLLKGKKGNQEYIFIGEKNA